MPAYSACWPRIGANILYVRAGRWKNYCRQVSKLRMDIIYLQDLRIAAVIGVYPWERCVKQIISLDLEMAADIRRAAASDRLDATLDYKAVAKRLIDFVG